MAFSAIIITPVRHTYLATLGLSMEADQQTIKTAFRRLASIYHPDKNPTQRQRFIEICHAYDQLMTPTADNSHQPVKVSHSRRLGKRGEPKHRRFEILLEQQYKGVNIRTQA